MLQIMVGIIKVLKIKVISFSIWTAKSFTKDEKVSVPFACLRIDVITFVYMWLLLQYGGCWLLEGLHILRDDFISIITNLLGDFNRIFVL